MDAVIDYLDERVLSQAYAKIDDPLLQYFSAKDSPLRLATTILILLTVGGCTTYLLISSLSYVFLFERKLTKHPKYLKNQIRKEIILSLKAIPVTALATLPWIYMDYKGYAKLYSSVSEYGWPYFFLSIFIFWMCSDFLIYWIHRLEHHPSLYFWLHKQHHSYKITTPFTSYSFHPLDGYFQSLPYHVLPFMFPLHKILHLCLFMGVQIWTISIHDNTFFGKKNRGIINSAAFHSVHHLKYKYNYGQYTCLWDRLCGSYLNPGENFAGKLIEEIKK